MTNQLRPKEAIAHIYESKPTKKGNLPVENTQVSEAFCFFVFKIYSFKSRNYRLLVLENKC